MKAIKQFLTQFYIVGSPIWFFFVFNLRSTMSKLRKILPSWFLWQSSWWASCSSVSAFLYKRELSKEVHDWNVFHPEAQKFAILHKSNYAENSTTKVCYLNKPLFQSVFQYWDLLTHKNSLRSAVYRDANYSTYT